MDCAFLEKWLINGHDVETCVLLSRGTYRQPDARVKIDVELEDYYAIKDMKKSGE